MKRLTLNEIGKLAGVSAATVSRVINNYPHVTQERRERVQEVIAQTGFQPNLIARSLASQRTNIIGLVIPNVAHAVFTDPYFPNLIQGITQASNRRNLTLALFLFHSMQEETRTIQSILNATLLDGLIITADRKEYSLVPQIVKQGLPFILVGRPESKSEPSAEITYVNTDNIAGGYLATEHLITLGRRRIAIIASDLNTAGDDRYTGYRNALRDHNISFDAALVAQGDFSLESGYAAMQKLLPEQPDAVFASSDNMGLGAQRAIRDAGLRIPQDIAIVGYDDLPPAMQAEPQLTTIRQPVEQMGITAVELLSQFVSSSIAPASVIFPVELIIRASCGAEQSG